MAFPTSAIVDTFNRANENPLVTASSGATWAQFSGAGGVGLTALQVQTNVCAATSGASQMYIVGADGADCEVYATLTTKGGTGAIVDLGLGIIDTGSITTIDGYGLRMTVGAGGADDTIEIVRIDNLVATRLGAVFSQEFSAGDSFGLSRVGSTLEAWYNSGGGGWTSLGTRTDGTYSSGGVKTLGIISTATRIDDFGGGTVVGGTTYFLTVDGTLTMSGTLQKQDNKVFAAALTMSGALSKRVNKTYAGTLTSAGAIVKQVGKVLSGGLTPSGVLAASKTAVLSIAGTLGISGDLSKQPGKVFSGALTSGGALVKQTGKNLAGTLTSSGAAAFVKAAFLTVGGVLGISGDLSKRTSTSFTGVLTSTASLIKQVNKSFAGNLTPSGVLASTKTALLSIGGTLGMSGSLSKHTSTAFSGVLTFVGSISKRVSKAFEGILSFIGTFMGVNTGGGGGIESGLLIYDDLSYPLLFDVPPNPLAYDANEYGVIMDASDYALLFDVPPNPIVYD